MTHFIIAITWRSPYLRRYPLDEAMTIVRTGLQALAAAWGAPVDDVERGYHETMTQAWVRLVHLSLSDRAGPRVQTLSVTSSRN